MPLSSVHSQLLQNHSWTCHWLDLAEICLKTSQNYDGQCQLDFYDRPSQISMIDHPRFMMKTLEMTVNLLQPRNSPSSSLDVTHLSTSVDELCLSQEGQKKGWNIVKLMHCLSICKYIYIYTYIIYIYILYIYILVSNYTTYTTYNIFTRDILEIDR